MTNNPYAKQVDAVELNKGSAVHQRAVLADEIRLAGIRCGAVAEGAIPNGPELIATIRGMADRIIELSSPKPIQPKILDEPIEVKPLLDSAKTEGEPQKFEGFSTIVEPCPTCGGPALNRTTHWEECPEQGELGKKLIKVQKAVDNYHLALDRGEDVTPATYTAMERIELVLKRPWVEGKMLEMLAKHPRLEPFYDKPKEPRS